MTAMAYRRPRSRSVPPRNAKWLFPRCRSAVYWAGGLEFASHHRPDAGDQARILRGEEGAGRSRVGGLANALQGLNSRMKLRPISVRAKFDMSVSITPGATEEQIAAQPNWADERQRPPFPDHICDTKEVEC